MRNLFLFVLLFAASATVSNAERISVGRSPDEIKPQPSVVSPKAAENLIKNGGFEDGPHPEEWLTLTKGDRRLPDWIIAKGTVDLMSSSYLPAYKGDASLDLDGTMPGGVGQFIETVPGKTYRVSFAIAGNPLGEPKTKLLQVRIADKVIDYKIHVTLSGNARSIVWKHTHFNFVAKQKRYHLDFESMDEEETCGPMIDEVEVTLAPSGPEAPSNPELHKKSPVL